MRGGLLSFNRDCVGQVGGRIEQEASLLWAPSPMVTGQANEIYPNFTLDSGHHRHHSTYLILFPHFPLLSFASYAFRASYISQPLLLAAPSYTPTANHIRLPFSGNEAHDPHR